MGFLYSQFFVTPKYPTKSFSGQTVIVTGSNIGLGKEAVRHFAQLGAARIIMGVRNTQAGEQARQDILKSTKYSSDALQVWKLDLSSYDSVKAFAKKAESELDRIDVLLENAGVASNDAFAKDEGHERMVTVNVISTFLLGMLLFPKLKGTAKEFNIKPRWTIVTSEVHGWAKFPEWKADNVFEALDDENSSTKEERYPASKLLEVLVIRQIAPKIADSNVILNMLNPGLCHSELARDGGWVLWAMKQVLARSTEVGSRTLLAAASADEESHGKYMNDGVVEDDHVSPFVQSADGDVAAKKVWGELRGILESVQKGVTQGF